jgi:hypothetical protein
VSIAWKRIGAAAPARWRSSRGTAVPFCGAADPADASTPANTGARQDTTKDL